MYFRNAHNITKMARKLVDRHAFYPFMMNLIIYNYIYIDIYVVTFVVVRLGFFMVWLF